MKLHIWIGMARRLDKVDKVTSISAKWERYIPNISVSVQKTTLFQN